MTPFGLYSFYRVYRQLPKKKEFVRVKTEKFENIQTHKKKGKDMEKIKKKNKNDICWCKGTKKKKEKMRKKK